MSLKIKLLLFLAILFQIEIVMSQKAEHNSNPIKSFNIKVKKSNIHINDSNVRLVLKKQFSIPNDYDFIETDGSDKRQSLKGSKNSVYRHERYKQYYKGIKIECSDIRVRYKNDSVVSANGDYVVVKAIDIKPSISKKQAIEYAIKYVNAKKYVWEDADEVKHLQEVTNDSTELFYPKPELVISENGLNPNDTGLYLAYKIDIYAIEPLNRADIYVNAKSGEIINYENKISFADGEADTRYSGRKMISTSTYLDSNRIERYLLVGCKSDSFLGNKTINANNTEKASSIYIKNFTDNNNLWDSSEFNNSKWDNAALDAHWGSMMAYEYFLKIHGRKSYDSILINNKWAGRGISNYVHWRSKYWFNAWWDGFQICYGDGEGVPATTLDIVAHEFGHAVCQYSAKLRKNKFESLIINEALSDIWAACVENFAAPQKQKWLIGEELYKNSTGRIAWRSMSDPTSVKFMSPNTYGKDYWIPYNPSCIPTQDNDCGAHKNSTVMSHWFYILTVGKSSTNGIGNNYNVTGITIDKAAKIVYKAETEYMTMETDFINVRQHTIDAAIDLYGDCSQEVVSTANAWYAVGVGSQYISDQLISDTTYISNTIIEACNVELSNVKVQNGAKLTIDAKGSVTINGEFDINLGSELEIK